MSMSPRLLRPRSTVHPEAAAWAARVVANGGTVSGVTLSAVSKFCASIDSAGIRDRFFRLNLFCGGTSGTAVGLNSALVPLYRGPSLGGTQYGFNVDDNVGGVFVGGDYNATGPSGGLAGGGTRYLNTGFATNTLSDGNRHLSAYETVRSGSNFDRFMGSESDVSISQSFTLGYGSASNQVQFGFGAFGASLNATASTAASHWIGSNSSAGSGVIYRNGVQDTTGLSVASTPTSSSVFVFALNRASTPAAPATDIFGGRLAGYSMGLLLDATQAAAYYAALQAFQTALTRNV
jgi:hypothetical protein